MHLPKTYYYNFYACFFAIPLRKVNIYLHSSLLLRSIILFFLIYEKSPLFRVIIYLKRTQTNQGLHRQVEVSKPAHQKATETSKLTRNNHLPTTRPAKSPPRGLLMTKILQQKDASLMIVGSKLTLKPANLISPHHHSTKKTSSLQCLRISWCPQLWTPCSEGTPWFPRALLPTWCSLKPQTPWSPKLGCWRPQTPLCTCHPW